MRVLPLGIFVALCSSLVIAQSQTGPPASATRLTFEVASIKQNKSGSPSGGANAQPGGRVTIRNTSLYDLVRNGQGLQPYEIAGANDSLRGSPRTGGTSKRRDPNRQASPSCARCCRTL